MNPSDSPVVLLGPLPLSPFESIDAGPVLSGFRRALADGRGADRIARAEALGLPRAASPLVKALVGWLVDREGGAIVAPVPGVLTDHRAALSALPACWTIRHLPLQFGAPAACADGLRRLIGAAPSASGDAGEARRIGAMIREQEAGVRSSDRMAMWLRDLQEPGPVGDPGPEDPARDRTPLLALGPWTLIEDLPIRIEALGGRVVWDEEGVQGAALARAVEPAVALSAWPALDPARRFREIRDAAARTGARGVVLVMEAFTGALLDEICLRGVLDLPILALDVEAPGPMDPARRLRLEAFLRVVGAEEGDPDG